MLRLAKKLLYTLSVIAFVTMPIVQARAQMTLQITDVKVVSVIDEKVTIQWSTNIPASGKIDFGLDSAYGTYLILGNGERYTHEITLSNLTPKTTYHYSITAKTLGQEISTFDRTFKTTKDIDTTMPTISNVHVAYVTATTATIQWETDEPTTSVVRYGTTTNYTKRAGSGGRTKTHEVTIKGLKGGTTYHFQVSSADADKNTAVYSDITFTTMFNSDPEKTPLTISEVRPLTMNDSQLGTDRAIISWSTNKLATGAVRFGASRSLGKSISQTSLFKTFQHEVILTSLKPDTTYYMTLQSKDVFGKSITTDTYSFKTRKITPVPRIEPTLDQPLVLGFSTVARTPVTALYRVKDTKDVYAIVARQRYRIVDLVSLKRFSTKTGVRDVSRETLEKYPLVTLVKATDGQTVYHLYRRANNRILKLALPSPSAFASYPANRWDAIVSMDQAEIDRYQDASLIRARGSATIYLLEKGTKRAVTSESTFRSKGYLWSDVVEVSEKHLAEYPSGPSIQ